MRGDYKIVVNTAAGRMRYMKLLVPYVLSCDIVDRYDLWVNTVNTVDLRFLELLAKKYDKINLMYIEDNKFRGLSSIFGFYKKCTESKTVYVKVDDDLIWMEPNAIVKLVDYHIANPHFFLVSPLVINNCTGAYLLQTEGKIKFSKYLRASMAWDSGWCSATIAYNMLDWFRNRIMAGSYETLYMGPKPIAMQRFSINMISWFGDVFAKFGGECLMNDEEYYTVVKPTEMSLSNCILSDDIVVHYAFTDQREELDKTDILEKYTELIKSDITSEGVKEYYYDIDLLSKKAYTTDVSIPNYVDVRKETGNNHGLIGKVRRFLGTIKMPGTYNSLGRIKYKIRESSFLFDSSQTIFE